MTSYYTAAVTSPKSKKTLYNSFVIQGTYKMIFYHLSMKNDKKRINPNVFLGIVELYGTGGPIVL